jgi:hypothetical protein
VAWPIQDLPYPLVFFCHHNPVDREAGFRPVGEAPPPSAGGSATTGTEDVLLYEDIIEALTYTNAPPAADASELRKRLGEVCLKVEGRVGPGPGGVRLFDEHGGRRSGTGEHVVCLRPKISVEVRRGSESVTRVLPQASVEVWAWRAGEQPDSGYSWHQLGPPLDVSYVGSIADSGGGHDAD